MKCHSGSTTYITLQFKKSAFHEQLQNLLFEKLLCCKMHYITRNRYLTLRVMHSMLALVESPSTRIIRDWGGQVWREGEGENGLAAKRGRNDHGSSCGAEMLLNGPQSQWDITLMTDASLENALLQWAWNHSSSPGCCREYLTRIPNAFTVARMHSFLLPSPQMFTLPHACRI